MTECYFYNKFKCKKCNEVFFYKINLEKHTEKYHNEKNEKNKEETEDEIPN